MDIGYGHASLFAHHHEWSTSCLERASGGPSSPSQAFCGPLLCLLFSVRGWGLEGVRGPRNSRGRIPTSFPFTVAVCLCVQAHVQRQVESALKRAIAKHPRNNFPEGIPKHLKTPGETWPWEIIIPYLEIAPSSKSENSECFINSERLKEFTKLLLVSVSGTICKLVWIEWQLVWFGWHMGIAACHTPFSSVPDGGGSPLRAEVEGTGDAQPGSAGRPPGADLEWREESCAAGAPVLEAEHFPFLRQTQVAAEALATRETDGGGRRGLHWGTSTRRVHGEFTVICIGFVLDPQALLCPSLLHTVMFC